MKPAAFAGVKLLTSLIHDAKPSQLSHPHSHVSTLIHVTREKWHATYVNVYAYYVTRLFHSSGGRALQLQARGLWLDLEHAQSLNGASRRAALLDAEKHYWMPRSIIGCREALLDAEKHYWMPRSIIGCREALLDARRATVTHCVDSQSQCQSFTARRAQ